METAGHSVELNKSGGDSGDAAFTLVQLLDRLDRVHHLVFHGKHLAFEAVFAHGENALFLVSTAHALGGGRNDLPQNVFVANNVEVVPDICGGRDKGEKAGDKCGAADAVE